MAKQDAAVERCFGGARLGAGPLASHREFTIAEPAHLVRRTLALRAGLCIDGASGCNNTRHFGCSLAQFEICVETVMAIDSIDCASRIERANEAIVDQSLKSNIEDASVVCSYDLLHSLQRV
jgi:hypothetical protein